MVFLTFNCTWLAKKNKRKEIERNVVNLVALVKITLTVDSITHTVPVAISLFT